MKLDGTEVLLARDTAAWEAWLEAHAGDSTGVWLKIAKKGKGGTSVTLSDALDAALCFGWIDSIRKSCDEEYYLQKYSPRRPRGSWSRINVDRVAELTAAGRMRPAGTAEVERAKADGRWAAAYESQAKATVPADLAEALAADPVAAEGFGALGKTERYAVILELAKARTAERRGVVLGRALGRLRGE
ncbi:YdeI/OmpD-associated family protein [Phytomonospora sp. NPDC050363]|uniref:YdeI/OmpD-associated family protein n=1 Tax=Phytomonospora sp. NPDC050363 TaxID=3155642 RepID=UPI0033E83106